MKSKKKKKQKSNTNSSPSAPWAHIFVSDKKCVLVLRERNWYDHDNPARENLFKKEKKKKLLERSWAHFILMKPWEEGVGVVE